MRAKLPCVYCTAHADSREHVLATRFVDLLREDPRGFPMPPVLRVQVPGIIREIGGRQLPGRRRTVELTAPACANCNSQWMNDVDSAAFPWVAGMIRGHQVTLGLEAATAVATWICKVAVTARAAPHAPLPISPAWTKWLYENRSPIPHWHVWVGFYDGREPFAYFPNNVSTEILDRGPHGLRPSGRVTYGDGALATLVVGYLIAQVLGFDGPFRVAVERPGMLPLLWPSVADLEWPPHEIVTDETLPAVVDRLVSRRRR